MKEERGERFKLMELVEEYRRVNQYR